MTMLESKEIHVEQVELPFPLSNTQFLIHPFKPVALYFRFCRVKIEAGLSMAQTANNQYLPSLA